MTSFDVRRERPSKAILLRMLKHPSFTWRNLNRLANAIAADRETTIRLLLELGARASGNNPELWALPENNRLVELRVIVDLLNEAETYSQEIDDYKQHVFRLLGEPSIFSEDADNA